MARLLSKLNNTATIGGIRRSFTQQTSKSATSVLDYEIEYDHKSETMYNILNVTPGTKGSANRDDWKQLTIHNNGKAVAELQFKSTNYYDNSDADTYHAASEGFIVEPAISMLLRPGEFISLPNPRCIVYNETDESAATAKAIASGTLGDTDTLGYITHSTYFGQADTKGIVPGSFSAQFYMPGYQEIGMTNSTNKREKQISGSDTGLAANTAYEFKIAVDGGAATRISFTTDTSNTRWGGTNGVLSKINATLNGFFRDGTLPSRVSCHIVNGDIRFTSGSRQTASEIALTAGTTPTAEFFGTGRIPAQGDIDSAVAATVETPALLGLPEDSTDHLLIDKGNGFLVRALGGSGTINYDEGGEVTFNSCPRVADFNVKYYYDSAHSGENDATSNEKNTITAVGARSVNIRVPAKLRVTMFN